MVVIWNTSQVTKSGQVSVMSKAHTDVDIERMRVASFDDTRWAFQAVILHFTIFLYVFFPNLLPARFDVVE